MMHPQNILKISDRLQLQALDCLHEFTVKRASLLDWLRLKVLKTPELLSDEQIRQVLFSPFREPEEGASHRIGKVLFGRGFFGDLRRFQVYGVRSGGFSNVFTVIELETLQTFCLKESRLIHRSWGKGDENLTNEAKIWFRFGRHPNLPEAHAVYTIGSRRYLLIDHVPGQSLRAIINYEQIPVATILKLAMQICRALIYAQEVYPGFVHGDLKPSNCLITPDWNLKLTDFGQSYTCIDESGAPAASEAYQTGFYPRQIRYQKGGTYAYMAPEKFSSAQPAGIQSDVYSFGVTLFEMLTGETPFPGPEYRDYFAQHRFAVPAADKLQLPNVPSRLAALTLRCLSKKTSERFRNFFEIENELALILRENFAETLAPASKNQFDDAQAIRRGAAFAALGEYDEALSWLEYGAKINPANTALPVYETFVLAAAGRLDEARRFMLTTPAAGNLTDASLDLAELFLTRAKLYFLLGENKTALEQVEKFLARHSGQSIALNLKGEILFKTGKWQKAAGCFKKALAIDPNFPAPLYNLSLYYKKTGKLLKALFYARKARQVDSQEVKIVDNLAEIYFYLRNSAKAVECYKEALILDCRLTSAARGYVIACGALYSESGGTVDRRLFEFLCRIIYHRESPADGFDQLIEFVAERNYDPLIFYFIEWAFHKLVDKFDARRRMILSDLLERVFLEIQTRHLPPECYFSIGKLLFMIERYEQCKVVFDSCLKLNGGDEKSFYYLAACYEINEDFETSLHFYRKAVKQNAECELNRSGLRRVAARLKEAVRNQPLDREESVKFVFTPEF